MTVQLAPVSVLNEGELAEQLGMSRTPVHEAVLLLRREGLVDIRPQYSSLVSLIDVRLIEQGYALRMMLEPEVFRRVAGRLTPAQKRLLEKNMVQQEQWLARLSSGGGEASPAEVDMEAYYALVRLDDAFHEMLFHLADFAEIHAAARTVTTHYERIRYLDTILNCTHAAEVLADHRRFQGYLCAGIPEEADLAAEFEAHLGRFRSGLSALMARYPDYFK